MFSSWDYGTNKIHNGYSWNLSSNDKNIIIALQQQFVEAGFHELYLIKKCGHSWSIIANIY